MNHKTTTTTVLIAIASVAAMLLAAGTIVTASNHSAFAWKDKGYKKDNYQKDDSNYVMQKDGSEKSGISIPVITSIEQECQSAGGTSPITGACIATSTNTVTESGGILGK